MDSERASILLKMMDFSLFKDPIFMMYAASNFLTSIGFNVPYVFTVDRAVAWDISGEDAAFLQVGSELENKKVYIKFIKLFNKTLKVFDKIKDLCKSQKE